MAGIPLATSCDRDRPGLSAWRRPMTIRRLSTRPPAPPKDVLRSADEFFEVGACFNPVRCGPGDEVILLVQVRRERHETQRPGVSPGFCHAESRPPIDGRILDGPDSEPERSIHAVRPPECRRLVQAFTLPRNLRGDHACGGTGRSSTGISTTSRGFKNRTARWGGSGSRIRGSRS